MHEFRAEYVNLMSHEDYILVFYVPPITHNYHKMLLFLVMIP